MLNSFHTINQHGTVCRIDFFIVQTCLVQTSSEMMWNRYGPAPYDTWFEKQKVTKYSCYYRQAKLNGPAWLLNQVKLSLRLHGKYWSSVWQIFWQTSTHSHFGFDRFLPRQASVSLRIATKWRNHIVDATKSDLNKPACHQWDGGAHDYTWMGPCSHDEQTTHLMNDV